MGMDLLTLGWTVRQNMATVHQNKAGPDRNEVAERLHHIINALPDVWFTDERVATLDESDYYAPLEGDGPEAALSNLRNALTVGCEDYVLHLIGGHRYGTAYPIPGTDMWFHIAGGGSYGDDPYEDWHELGIFLNACDLLRELREAAGFVCGGLPRQTDLTTIRTKVKELRREAIEQRSERDQDSVDDGARLAWHLWDGSVANYEDVLLIIDGIDADEADARIIRKYNDDGEN